MPQSEPARRDERLGLAHVVGEDRRRQALRRPRCAARSPRRSRGSASRRGSARRSRAAPGRSAPASRPAPGGHRSRRRSRRPRRARRRAPCRRPRAASSSARCMPSKAALSISGPTSVPSARGSPIFTRAIDLLQARHEAVVDALVDEQAAQRRAALARRAHGREGDAAQRQVEIGRRRHDRGVVAAELEDRAGEALRRACGPTARPMAVEPVAETSGTAVIVDQGLADLAAADQHLATGRPARRRSARAARSNMAWVASAVSGVFSDGFQTHACRRRRRRAPRSRTTPRPGS